MLVHAHFRYRTFFARHLYRDNLLRQNAILLRPRGALLAAQGKCVLIGTAYI